MARAKAELSSGTRLADYLAIGLLARVLPAERVHEALNAHDVNSQRVRRYPAVGGCLLRHRFEPLPGVLLPGCVQRCG